MKMASSSTLRKAVDDVINEAKKLDEQIVRMIEWKDELTAERRTLRDLVEKLSRREAALRQIIAEGDYTHTSWSQAFSNIIDMAKNGLRDSGENNE